MSVELQNLLNKAIELAQIAHANQIDKGGKPYIEHPLRVMNALPTLEEKIVGVLHDVVEDSDLTLEKLIELQFPANIVNAVNALTKRRKEKYEDYLNRVMANPLALRVKIADMQDNMDLDRIPEPTEKDYKRLAKYESVMPKLLEALNVSR